MTSQLIDTCPLCSLRFSNRPLLELHIRDDHVRTRGRAPQEPADDDESPPAPDLEPDQAPADSLPESRPVIRDASSTVAGGTPESLADAPASS